MEQAALPPIVQDSGSSTAVAPLSGTETPRQAIVSLFVGSADKAKLLSPSRSETRRRSDRGRGRPHRAHLTPLPVPRRLRMRGASPHRRRDCRIESTRNRKWRMKRAGAKMLPCSSSCRTRGRADRSFPRASVEISVVRGRAIIRVTIAGMEPGLF